MNYTSLIRIRIRKVRFPYALTLAGIFMAAFAGFSNAVFAQSPTPVNFVSAPLFSGVGHGDRIPGAAGVIALAVGDFNNDGKIDVITTNSDVNANGLGLILGNGDGTFQPPLEVDGFDVYGGMGGIVAGDFNSDGSLDFATMWGLGGPIQVGVYLGDGHGAFTFNNSYSIGTAITRSVATADLNGDGKLDLIAPNPSNNAVAVLYGNGNGTFQNAIDFPAAVPGQTSPTGVAIADFNKDGKPDIVVASSTGCCPFGGGITVLLNSGNGVPGAPVLYPNPSGTDSAQVAVADLNADGNLDVVESSLGGNNVAVFLGSSNGTFQAAKNFLAPWGSSLAIGNLTGDKKPDIVATSYYDGTVWVLTNKGSGNFVLAGVYSSDWSALAIALADFNGDKKLDFVTGNQNGQYMTVALGNGDGTFRDSAHYNESGGMWTNGIAVADFNRDLSPDLVQAGGGTGVGLSLMLGTSHGVPKAPTFINLGGSPYSQVNFVLAADISGDNKPDIVSGTAAGYSNPYGIVVLIGKGTGKFNAPVVYPSSPSSYPVVGALADLNSDGKPDVLTSNTDGTMSALLNKGKGVYGTATVFPSGTGPYPTNFVGGDFNGDNKPDLLLNDFPAQNLILHLGKGDGTFQPPVATHSLLHPYAPITADFNQDNKLDLAIPSYEYGGSMMILLGNGNGTFTQGAVYYFYPQDYNHEGQFLPNAGAVLDLNGDGNLDIAIAPAVSSYRVCGAYRCAEQYLGALVFLGNGDGTFVQQSGWQAGISPTYVATGDFNRDGMIDLAYLSSNINYGLTSVTLLQNSTQPLSVSPLSIKFPAKVVGTSNKQTVLLTNNQSVSLTINSVAIGGANPADFTAKSACGSHLAAGAYCTLSVTFAPTAAGNRSAILVLTDSIGVQNVQLNGVGK